MRSALVALLLVALLAGPADAATRSRIVTRTAAGALAADALRVRVMSTKAMRLRVVARAGRRAITRAKRVRLRSRRPRVVKLRLTAYGRSRLARCSTLRLTLVTGRRRATRRLKPGARCVGPANMAGEPVWPSMRHDSRNTGRSALVPRIDPAAKPWTFRTAKGIFSTPIVGPDGTVFVGSADTRFYALDERGRTRWSFKTGGIIDAAGTLDGDTLVMGSGDENLYRLSGATGAERWRFPAPRPPAGTQLVNWWEGNVARGPDGDVYAGNTGGGAYRLSPDAKLRWVHQSGNSVWTTPAFGPDGTTYWGSLDLNVFALDRDGNEKWKTSTLGYVVSSPALSKDGGTLYVGSFDDRLYALDAATGAPRWTFQTRDHVYASPALSEDGQTVYIASTDGSVYAVDAATGTQRWRYDTGDPVRSSPVLGRSPDGAPHDVVYAGSADGSLYAIDADTGERRWSYDTTPADPALRDRNDLNGSPALTPTGIVIGGEHGDVTFVPYDWCRRARDARCTTGPGQPFGPDLARVFSVTSGGATRVNGLDGGQSTALSLAARLVVRRGGQTADAALKGPSVTIDPAVPSSVQVSGDGRHVFVVPDGFLAPDATYRVRVAGPYTTDGARPAGGAIGATGAGLVDDTLTIRTGPAGGPFPLQAGADRVDALRLRRLAVPLPAFLTSVNQIGFDSYDLIAGTLATTPPDGAGEGRFLLWVVGGRPGPGGTEVADPKGGFGFPIAGRYRGDAFILSRRDLNLTFSFGEVPTRRFELRGSLGADLKVRPGANLYTEVFCPAVPNYGPLLVAIGLCNESGTLAAAGTFLTDRYDPRGGASSRPGGVRVTDVALTRPTTTTAGEARATLDLPAGYDPKSHVLSVVVADAGTLEPVTVDYVKGTTVSQDGRTVRIALPAGTDVPQRARLFVVADAFPLAAKDAAG